MNTIFTLFLTSVLSISAFALDPLNQTDKKAITEYTGARFKGLNQSLREGKGIPKTEVQFYKDLKKALEKITPYKGTGYRGAYLDPKAVQHIKNKGFVSDEAFNSATMDQELGKSYSYDGSAFLEIQSQTGRPIIEYSTFPDEKEFVFLPYTVFKGSIKGKVKVKNPLFANTPGGDSKEVDHIILIEQKGWPSAPVRSLSNGEVIKAPKK